MNHRIKLMALGTVLSLILTIAWGPSGALAAKSTVKVKRTTTRKTKTPRAEAKFATTSTLVAPTTNLATTTTLPPVVGSTSTTAPSNATFPEFPIYDTTRRISENGGGYATFDYSYYRNTDGTLSYRVELFARCQGETAQNSPSALAELPLDMMGRMGLEEFTPRVSVLMRNTSNITRLVLRMDIPLIDRFGRPNDLPTALANLIMANDLATICTRDYKQPARGVLAAAEYIEAVRRETATSLQESQQFVSSGGKMLVASVYYSGDFTLPDREGKILKNGPAMYFRVECFETGVSDTPPAGVRPNTTTRYLELAGINDATGSFGLNSFWRKGPNPTLHLTYQSFPDSLSRTDVTDKLNRYKKAVNPSQFCQSPSIA